MAAALSSFGMVILGTLGECSTLRTEIVIIITVKHTVQYASK